MCESWSYAFLVLDTNVVLYHLGNRLQQPLKKKRYAISIITEIELLSYPNIRANEINVIQNFIAQTTVIELRNSIKTETAKLLPGTIKPETLTL